MQCIGRFLSLGHFPGVNLCCSHQMALYGMYSDHSSHRGGGQKEMREKPRRPEGKSSAASLVLPSRSSLAGLQLFHVPPADGHVALVLVHAIGEVLDVHRTRARRLGGTLRVVVDGLLCLHLCLWLFGGSGRRRAREETSDGVANGGTDCDATEQEKGKQTSALDSDGWRWMIHPRGQRGTTEQLTLRCWPSDQRDRAPETLELVVELAELGPPSTSDVAAAAVRQTEVQELARLVEMEPNGRGHRHASGAF